MTFAQLRALHAVALTGSVTRAAEQLLMTQPAVSHAIRGLERELGVSLLVRRPDGVSLTSVGADVAQRAIIILAQLEGLAPMPRRPAEHHSITLRIGVLSSVNARIMPALLRSSPPPIPTCACRRSRAPIPRCSTGCAPERSTSASSPSASTTS